MTQILQRWIKCTITLYMYMVIAAHDVFSVALVPADTSRGGAVRTRRERVNVAADTQLKSTFTTTNQTL